MYSNFFGQKSNIIGIGIEQRLENLPENIHVYTWGTYMEPNFIKFFVCKNMIDVIIDSSFTDQLSKFKTMWPCLNKNGLYLIEVLHYLTHT